MRVNYKQIVRIKNRAIQRALKQHIYNDMIKVISNEVNRINKQYIEIYSN